MTTTEKPAKKAADPRPTGRTAAKKVGDTLEAERQDRIIARDGHTPVDHDSLQAALAAFQSDMPTVHKGQTARIPGKDGRGGYTYQYADLADVAKVAHPLLAKHGLSFVCVPTHLEGVGFVLQGVLRHASGGQDTGILPITGRSAQDLGSSLTYLRRYLLGCMTGIVTDEDEDGEMAADAGTQRPQAEAPPAYQAAPAPQTQAALAANAQAVQGNRSTESIALEQDLSVLDPIQQAAVRDWWTANNVPAIASLNADQVAQVRDEVRRLLHPGGQDPHPAR